jgi:hypothetical protein
MLTISAQKSFDNTTCEKHITCFFSRVFGSMIAVAFHSKMHQHNIFLFFKKLILTSALQNDLKTPKNINLKQIKKMKKIF